MVRAAEKPNIKTQQSGSTPQPFFVWLRHRTKYTYWARRADEVREFGYDPDKLIFLARQIAAGHGQWQLRADIVQFLSQVNALNAIERIKWYEAEAERMRERAKRYSRRRAECTRPRRGR